MAKRAVMRFDNRLDDLFHDRTFRLRQMVGSLGKGNAPLMNRRKVNRTIAVLQDLASDSLIDDVYEDDFMEYVDDPRQWFVTASKGRGEKKKKKSFNDWYRQNIGYPNCIYIFWNYDRCVYVGRTGAGGSRPTNHFDRAWFIPITRIVVYGVKQASQLPKLECIARHEYEPTRNRIKPAQEKFQKKCPICIVHKQIDKELRTIFALKRKRRK